MLLRKKAQSTAEYAITIGLVVAVAAGVLSTSLKGGIRKKHEQAMNVLLAAGNDVTGFGDAAAQTAQNYTQEYRKTTILDNDNYVDRSILEKGGSKKTMRNGSP